MSSWKGIPLLGIKGLPIDVVNERIKIHNGRRKSNTNGLHIQDIQLIHYGHDDKASD